LLRRMSPVMAHSGGLRFDEPTVASGAKRKFTAD
jgi:hypothetical protein